MKIKFYLKNKKNGFTLVELMVTVGIFAIMTTLLLAKYGTFNQGIYLNNLSYDVALTIRNAQSYGLNVKSAPSATSTYSSIYTEPYGVHFDSSAGNNTSFTFFFDNSLAGDGIFDTTPGETVSVTTIKNGSKISNICVGSTDSDCSNVVSPVDITFKRPDPSAIIKVSVGGTITKYSFAKITLTASDGSIKNVTIRSTGQIAVTN